MKIQAQSSPQSQFVSQHRIPSVQAFSDSSVIMAAYLEALSSLLVLCGSVNDSDILISGVYENYATLRSVRDAIESDLDQADVMLEAIEAKLVL